MKNVRKIVGIILLLAVLLNLSAAVSAAGEITPYYNNVIKAETQATVSGDGMLTVRLTFTGIQGVTTGADITTYVEKKVLGLFWTRVEISSNYDNAWHNTVASYRYDGIRQFQLTETGTYRVTSEYVISGTGGAADEITATAQVTYN